MGENAKKCLSRVFMSLKDNFNLNIMSFFCICKENIVMFSQVKFEPDEPHSL